MASTHREVKAALRGREHSVNKSQIEAKSKRLFKSSQSLGEGLFRQSATKIEGSTCVIRRSAYKKLNEAIYTDFMLPRVLAIRAVTRN